MTYKELYDDAIRQLDSGKITVREFDKRVEPLNAEVRKKGEWIKQNPFVDTEECSCCGYNILSEEFETTYCPDCGADMGGEG